MTIEDALQVLRNAGVTTGEQYERLLATAKEALSASPVVR